MKRIASFFAEHVTSRLSAEVSVRQRLLVLGLLALLLCSSITAIADEDKRYNDIGNKIQCSCGCAQILIKCNHVGCQSSDTMIRQLRTALATYSNEEDVLNWFRRNYGMTVVVEPAKHGFELIIWVVPPLLVAAALLLVFWIIQRWRMRAVPVAAAPVDPHLDALRERARKETEL